MTTRLSVNLNAIAYLRNRRDLPWPDVIHLAKLALGSGAHGLTVHPRPDERHIRFSDLSLIRRLIDEEFPLAEFNMEGYPTDDFLELCKLHRPDQVTLVPDDPAQATSDHGWNFIAHADMLRPIIRSLRESQKRVSLFADATPEGLEVARSLEADRVEFYTGPYGSSYRNPEGKHRELKKLCEAGIKATKLGLTINAGHDLTVENLPMLIEAIPNLAEVSIGHGLIADALEFGMAGTVRRHLAAMSKSAIVRIK